MGGPLNGSSFDVRFVQITLFIIVVLVLWSLNCLLCFRKRTEEGNIPRVQGRASKELLCDDSCALASTSPTEQLAGNTLCKLLRDAT